MLKNMVHFYYKYFIISFILALYSISEAVEIVSPLDAAQRYLNADLVLVGKVISIEVKIIEEVDDLIPRLMNLNPDVVVVTGDHSTPSFLKIHSWHPVPTLIYSKFCRPDNVKHFGERSCITGGLGPRLPAVELIPIAMANALRIEKFGA